MHTGGFFLGYFASRLLRCDELTSRTISVEVGMQNSGLGAALAKAHFTSLPLAALPCAISATFHSVIGSMLAGIWRLRPVKIITIKSRMASGFGRKNQAARELCEQGFVAGGAGVRPELARGKSARCQGAVFPGRRAGGDGKICRGGNHLSPRTGLDPADFKTWNNLAGVLFDSLDKPMDAIRCMERAMKLEPQNKLGWSNLASMVGRLGRHEKALEFADRALALDPQMVEALLHKAAAAKALGKTEIVREVSEALAAIEAEKFQRAR